MTEIVAQSKRDREALLGLLQLAQSKAAAIDRPVLVSISLEVDFLEPLAVLESIWERTEWHAYFENVSEDFAFAAAEAVDIAEFSGGSRCEHAEAWVDDILSRCIEAGDTDEPFAGPQAMVGMTFSEKATHHGPFAPLTVWIPRWQVFRDSEKTIAVANAMIESDSDLEGIADRMLRAHGTFAGFDYKSTHADSPIKQSFERKSTDKAPFTTGVSKAVADIKAGEFKKVVLARSEHLIADSEISPILPLAKMKEQFWGCHCFAFGNDSGTTFIGATPEILFKRSGSSVKTHALAGSISRGSNAREDAEFGNQLINSKKDRHEQELVRESIERRLKGLGFETESNDTPKLLKLKNIQHLNTPITGSSPSPVSFWTLLSSLHPTPAVGGYPREIAVSQLEKYESLDRSLYAGAVGFLNKKGDGRMFVAIRSAAVKARSIEIFAGAGIVEASAPYKELQETVLKMNAMQSIFDA